jgi:hypothetical protein
MSDMNTDREWQRLLALYADKADEELLELHDRRDDLTELAQQALAKTMQVRGIEPEPAEEVPSAAASVLPGQDLGVGSDEVYLCAFDDPIRASVAREILDRDGVDHRMVVWDGGRGSGFRGQAYSTGVYLIVPLHEEARVREILRKELSQSFVDETEFVPMEDATLLGEFTQVQADLISRALEEHDIPYTTDYSQHDSTPVLVSVRAEQLEEAFDLMEQIADTLPE